MIVDKKNSIAEAPTYAEIRDLDEAMRAVRVAELVWNAIHQHDYSMSALASVIFDKYWAGEVGNYQDIVDFWNQMYQVLCLKR